MSAGSGEGDQKALAKQVIRDPRFRIYYVVPHEDQKLEAASVLKFYTPGILETAGVFEALANWPADIREIVADPKYILPFRVLGEIERRLAPIQLSSLEELANEMAGFPFKCIVSTAKTYKHISALGVFSTPAWLHVSSEKSAGVDSIYGVSPPVLHAYAREALLHFERNGGDEVVSRIAAEILQSEPKTNTNEIDGNRYRHGITIPNETALESFGFRFSNKSNIELFKRDSYIDASMESIGYVEEARKLLLAGYDVVPPNKCILTVSSPAWISRGLQVSRERLADRSVLKHINGLLRALIKQEYHYITASAPNKDILSNGVVRSLMSLVSREAGAYVASLAVSASQDLTPVVRLEPAINKIRSVLTDIGQCVRGNGPNRSFKEMKLVAALNREILEQIHPKYLAYLKKSASRIEGMRIVSDLPLELIPVDGIALGLRFDCSRIPLNPGNVSFGLLVCHTSQYLPRSAFQEILIIRSFDAADPLRHKLERALLEMSRRSKSPPKIRFLDVGTKAEFIDAVNQFEGALMIFDGHGARIEGTNEGALVIGGAPVDLWEARTELNLPPIVLLSACDTVPFDGSHGSVAVGLLAAGAKTVLATTLPIDGVKAAVLLARLVFRISEFLPVAEGFTDRQLEWRGFLSGLLRMMHVTEVALDLAKEYEIPDRYIQSIQIRANILINSRNPNWSEIINAKLDHWVRILGREPLTPGALARPTDVLKYVQLGNPEAIYIEER